MKYVWFTLITFTVCVCTATASAEEITLLVGQSRSLPTAPNQMIHVKGAPYIHIEDKKIAIQVTGRAPGEAHIQIGNVPYTIFVTGRRSNSLFSQFQRLLRTKLGLAVEMLNGQVAITGQLHRLQDWVDLSQIAQTSNAGYTFRARLDDDVREQALAYFRDQLLSRNLPTPNFVWSPYAHAIISQEDKNLRNLWDEALSPFGIVREYEKSAMSIKPLVRVKITLAEISKKARRQLGVDWPDSVTSQLLPEMQTPTLSVTLHALESEGLGQILASPNLLARSGSQASFLAGGEVPILAATEFYQQVTYKTYGISLKIKPLADYSGHLSIDLSSEVSTIDQANAVKGIPAFKTDRVTTHFDLPEPRTIVLSGLIHNEWATDSSELPYLSHLPILGRLFSSEDFRHKRSELLIFVTPEIVNVRDENSKLKIPTLKEYDHAHS